MDQNGFGLRGIVLIDWGGGCFLVIFVIFDCLFFEWVLFYWECAYCFCCVCLGCSLYWFFFCWVSGCLVIIRINLGIYSAPLAHWVIY